MRDRGGQGERYEAWKRMEEAEVSSTELANTKWTWNAKRAALKYVKHHLYEEDALMVLGREGFKRAARDATHSMVGRWKIRSRGFAGSRRAEEAESLMKAWAAEAARLAMDREKQHHRQVDNLDRTDCR